MPKVRKEAPSGKINASSQAKPTESSYWQQLRRGLVRSMHLDGHPLSRT